MNYKTFFIFRGFEQLSNSIGWQVMIVQSSAKNWYTWDYKKVVHMRLQKSGACETERVKLRDWKGTLKS